VNDDDEWTRKNIRALRGIQTYSVSVQAIKAYTSDHMAAGTDLQNIVYLCDFYIHSKQVLKWCLKISASKILFSVKLKASMVSEELMKDA
jgi:hypothetical protein